MKKSIIVFTIVCIIFLLLCKYSIIKLPDIPEIDHRKQIPKLIRNKKLIIKNHLTCHGHGYGHCKALSNNNSDFNNGQRNCWEIFWQNNKENKLVITPDVALCAFEPLCTQGYKRSNLKKTVVMGIGVHLGPAASGKFSVPCAGIKYISWEYRDKNLGRITNMLINGYSKEHLRKVQNVFWDKFHMDKDFRSTDIIVCGFDSWHCLIFAPFNKKLIMNSAYRFDGHIEINRANMIDLQHTLYQAIRYNPDIIMAGENIYDVMYHQHFLGSHKMIALPATCGYVQQRMQAEIKKGVCKGIQKNTTGYHPTLPSTIMISPNRLSSGGLKVANGIYKYFKINKLTKHSIRIMKKHMSMPYKYCDLGRYSALIVLGYSVMSYFTAECSALGIPMFVPTPRLYAQWEKDYHLIVERKGPLEHTSFNHMKQNRRSLNYGYNPNDDFNLESLERWVGYADYFYYKGVVQFDSYEELHHKIETSNLLKMNTDMLKHTKQNAARTKNHWRSIDRYFHGNEKEDIVPMATSTLPSSLAEGHKIWEEKIKRPDFEERRTKSERIESESETWIIIDYDVYNEEDNSLPNCNEFPNIKIVLYRDRGSKRTMDTLQKCTLVYYIENIKPLLPEIFKNLRWKTSKSMNLLIMVILATQNNARKIVNLEKRGTLTNTGCSLDSKYKNIVLTPTLWKQRIFHPHQYFLLWLPFDNIVTKYWIKTILKFITTTVTTEKEIQKSFDCLTVAMTADIKQRKYNIEEISVLEDYMKYWKTDETENFFQVLDQFNFELAVKGYVSKSDVLLYRYWLAHLTSCNIQTLPRIKLS